ncbi:tRNA (adenosine(37)-N6)-threonylcarbamoyltransferase complex dimerization subunit type 1 TsaB [Virgisporangium aurantiacum]|uniref:tRNA (Adenosine(37)-N6)-threonylcarbamoyltransferase complex dimerization subunit type 1 TsaB n=1 Tax=Virgisporangium aurantiacum TaxID=175570 RepID=A0A8J4E287_9ACTN|nr:tRNA (adenosine(37)-N6)-threonylcarbamoyltransferase complex dimerization subunit type 1 TsaB [Virgisporangium aurantiacum]GIJ58721.1 tRNA (adenosine(37)-N6)-threonylcarbamoyltransferase complex dimerization subunit type 1 TsaB [Virgisporangium aurantiacum]
MFVLVVDTATPAVTAAVANLSGHGEMLSAQVTVDGRAHGELLAPLIRDALFEARADPSSLAAIVAGVGPGPFTGLRVGLVTAAAMGHALGIPTYGVCSLDAFAYGVWGPLLVATDARRKELYWARYEDGVRVDGPSVDSPADVPVSAGRTAGEGAQRVLGRPVDVLYPPPLGLVMLAADRIRAKAPSEPLTPLYLRRPDAVPPGQRKMALQ